LRAFAFNSPRQGNSPKTFAPLRFISQRLTRPLKESPRTSAPLRFIPNAKPPRRICQFGPKIAIFTLEIVEVRTHAKKRRPRVGRSQKLLRIHTMIASQKLNWFTKASLLCLFLMAGSLLNAQTVKDFKVKNSTNTAERTIMLDLLRNKMKAEYKMEFKYLVNHFKVSGNFAWFKGDAQRKDDKTIVLPDDSYDCCHVECLFKKVNNKWTISEYAAFSTDLWYEGLQESSGAPAAIF
jgi:hypothetical protein